MASDYSNLKIQLMTTGENNTTWGNVTNTNLGTALDEAIAGTVNIAFSNADVPLTWTDTNSSQTARNMRLVFTGTATTGYNLVVPAIQKAYIVSNLTDGTITVKNATGTGVAVPAGKTMWVYNDAFNVADVVTHLSSLTTAGLTATSIGIGTSTPSALLQINAASGAADMRLSVGGTLCGNIYASASDVDIFAVTAIPIIFGTNNTERMRIDNAGRVVIGATSGAYKLDVPNNAVHFLETLIGNDTIGWSRTATSANVTYIQAGSLNDESAVAQPIVFGNMYGAGIERLRILATGGITSPDLADAVGYKGLPQNSQTGAYTLVLADMGKHISITTGGVVIPANSGTAFPIGSTIVIYNDSGSAQNISITTDTLRLAGTATTGTRSLAQRGLATCVKVKATEWVVSGNVA